MATTTTEHEYQTIPDTNYILNRGGSESDRLTQQYNLLKRLLGRSTALPASVNPNGIAAALDVGAGNLVWTLDLANTPEIRSRLPTSTNGRAVQNPVKLYACDYSTEQFPPQYVTDEMGITVFQQDITLPFPEDLHGKFDVVNVRLLTMALSERGWEKALGNLRELLKPDGVLVMFEATARWFRDGDTAAKWRYDPAETFDNDDWLDQITAILQWSCLDPNGFIPDFAQRLPDLLTSASYDVVSAKTLVTPMGKLASSHPGPDGRMLADGDGAMLAKIFIASCDGMTTNALKAGLLQDVQHRKIRTEEERKEKMASLIKGMDEEGAVLAFLEVVARRT